MKKTKRTMTKRYNAKNASHVAMFENYWQDAYRTAFYHKIKSLDEDEVRDVAIDALTSSIANYNFRKSVKFLTYLTTSIKQRMHSKLIFKLADKRIPGGVRIEGKKRIPIGQVISGDKPLQSNKSEAGFTFSTLFETIPEILPTVNRDLEIILERYPVFIKTVKKSLSPIERNILNLMIHADTILPKYNKQNRSRQKTTVITDSVIAKILNKPRSSVNNYLIRIREVANRVKTKMERGQIK